jgi:hypothetical protein
MAAAKRGFQKAKRRQLKKNAAAASSKFKETM